MSGLTAEPLGEALREHGPLATRTAGLRLLEPADIGERYLAWLTDPEVSRYLETRWQEQSLATIREFIDEVAASSHSELLAIVTPVGEHVGNLKVGPVDRFHGFADVSYFVGSRKHWGRGIATEAIRLACVGAFEVIGLERMQASVYQPNRASARVLEKAGFALEGRLREQRVRGEAGERCDVLCYGILRGEFARPEDAAWVGSG